MSLFLSALTSPATSINQKHGLLLSKLEEIVNTRLAAHLSALSTCFKARRRRSRECARVVKTACKQQGYRVREV